MSCKEWCPYDWGGAFILQHAWCQMPMDAAQNKGYAKLPINQSPNSH